MAEQEKAPDGTNIYRYDEQPEPEFLPASGDEEAIEAISEHIERHLGPVSGVLHELISSHVHIDVHCVAPSAEFPFQILVTSGMSDLPMTVPPTATDFRYGELCILLPSTWPIPQIGEVTGTAEEVEAHYWPIEWLKFLARFPHEYQSWLGAGHTIPNGEEAEPFADNTGLGCMLLYPAISLPEEFYELKINDEKTIYFNCLYPLYREEMELKLEQGLDVLLERFEQHGIRDVIDPNRPNVAL